MKCILYEGKIHFVALHESWFKKFCFIYGLMYKTFFIELDGITQLAVTDYVYFFLSPLMKFFTPIDFNNGNPRPISKKQSFIFEKE